METIGELLLRCQQPLGDTQRLASGRRLASDQVTRVVVVAASVFDPAATALLAAPPRRGCVCHRATSLSVFLVLFNLIVLVVYFGMHCTRLLDELAGSSNTNLRPWVGVTSMVEVVAGFCLTLGIISSLHVLVKVRHWIRVWGGGVATRLALRR